MSICRISNTVRRSKKPKWLRESLVFVVLFSVVGCMSEPPDSLQPDAAPLNNQNNLPNNNNNTGQCSLGDSDTSCGVACENCTSLSLVCRQSICVTGTASNGGGSTGGGTNTGGGETGGGGSTPTLGTVDPNAMFSVNVGFELADNSSAWDDVGPLRGVWPDIYIKVIKSGHEYSTGMVTDLKTYKYTQPLFLMKASDIVGSAMAVTIVDDDGIFPHQVIGQCEVRPLEAGLVEGQFKITSCPVSSGNFINSLTFYFTKQ